MSIRAMSSCLARMLDDMRIPEGLDKEWRHEREWLDALPRLVAECAALWDLELEEPYDTPGSLVVPAGAAVLKLNAPSHFEADHEADALACWDGRGAVRLLARDDERRALLLERCVPGGTLAEANVDEWLDRGRAPRATARHAASRAPIPPARRRGRPLGRGGAATMGRRRAAVRAVAPRRRARRVPQRRPRASRLVNQDLHGWNVLRSEREPWLVIDPKPLVGERELDGVGPLRNAGFSGDSGVVRRWLGVLATSGWIASGSAAGASPTRSRGASTRRAVVGTVDRGRAHDQPRLMAWSV